MDVTFEEINLVAVFIILLISPLIYAHCVLIALYFGVKVKPRLAYAVFVSCLPTIFLAIIIRTLFRIIPKT